MLFFNGLEQWGLLTLRISLGVIFAYHAIPKLKMPGAMAKGIGWLSGFVIILGLVEFFSSLAVILGVYTEVGAFFLGVVMLGALYYKIFKWKIPFYVMDKTGWEFNIARSIYNSSFHWSRDNFSRCTYWSMALILIILFFA